jgi:UPF0755 protein
MTDETDEDNEARGVDRLLSRFGTVPVDPNRTPPGPRQSGESLQRPKPGPRPGPRPAPRREPELVGTGASSAFDAAPLFSEPHDDVFGDAVPQSIEPQPSATVFADTPVEPREVIDRRDWVRMPRRSGPAFRFLIVACVIGFGVSFVYSAVTGWYDDQLDPPGEPGSTVEFAIESGATANDVTQDLFAKGVIANPTLFRYWLSDNFDGDFQAGDYSCLQSDMSFDEALECLDGEGPLPPQFFSITIPEGLTIEQMLAVLSRENPNYSRADLERDLQATLVSVGIEGVPDGPMPNSPDPTGSGKEGLLFPATYQIDEKKAGDTLDILIRMADTMESKFNDAVASDGRSPIIAELGLTDYEVLTIASLIEEEYRVPEDQAKISRVIYNRLLNRWSLGIDATACYAAQKSCADLNVDDLASSSPWNTRNLDNINLPPTPIASPSESSIRAALNPEPGPWFYYVLTGDDGSHTFAETDAEFQAAKQICIDRGFC